MEKLISEWENEINEKEALINATQEQIWELQEKIKKYKTNKIQSIIESLNLKEGSCLIGFNKYPQYHYDLIYGYKVLKIENTKNRLHGISFSYRVNDYEYSIHSEKECIPFSRSEYWIENFDLYVLPENIYLNLLTQLLEFKVTTTNVEEYKNAYTKGASVIVKTQ